MMTKTKDGAGQEAAISSTSSRKAPEAFLQAFGQRIVEGRMRKGWTRVELAGELGVSRERLAKWEHGKSSPPFEMLIALHEALGGSFHELVTGESPLEAVFSPSQREELKGHVDAMDRLLSDAGLLPNLTLRYLPMGDDTQGEKP